MKLGVAYIVFDGVELLESSIKQIRSHVDWISVIYQETSWFGIPLPKEDLGILRGLLSSKLIDDLSLYSSFTPLKRTDSGSINTSKEYERSKRNRGLFLSLGQGCTHYLCMDADEFYLGHEFAKAKDEIIKKGYESTAVRFLNYVKVPTLHRGLDSNYVPFICKISADSRMTNGFFVKCDPTRGIANRSKNSHAFDPSFIKMHHMETVRKRLDLKYKSTTRRFFDRTQIDSLVQNIRNISEESTIFSFNKVIYPGLGQISLTKCSNEFDIPYESWKS